MMYQKEIIYLNLYENGIKGMCAGYLKIEQRQDVCRLELQVKHMPHVAVGNFPVRLQGEADWAETAALEIKEGNGRWEGSSREQIRRVEIIISEELRIKGQSKAAGLAYLPPQSGKEQEIMLPPQSGKEQETMPQQPKRAEKPQEALLQPAIKAASGKPRPDREAAHLEATSMPQPQEPPPCENKWEQLLTTYEQIHPYGDNRVYVKLEPKDFIVLRSKYQHLVNNSFLLHGFYNYRYLILGREDDFYLGVPGVFYEREKMVALMFGFEAFECEGDQAQDGKFGYYLRKVEL